MWEWCQKEKLDFVGQLKIVSRVYTQGGPLKKEEGLGVGYLTTLP